MTAALQVRNATKIFGGQVALNQVSIEVQPGEVRALVGQNGCGKSTLIKILAGFHRPEPGTEAFVGGEPLPFEDAVASEALGLRFVHQDLGLVATMDAVDNMAIGQGYDTGRIKNIRWRRERAAAKEALAALGYDINTKVPVGLLGMSERTAVAIARAMSTRGTPPKMLILDEPTANLPGAEAQRLYKLVRRVADSGVAVLFVSHHFDEVFEMAESVTVLRDGNHIITRPVEGLTEEDLIELVVGRKLDEHVRNDEAVDHGAAVLEAKNITGARVSDLSFTVHAGEVVGVAGITGSGREEIAALVFGGHGRGGVVEIDGQALPPSRPDISIDRGVALVPAERHANASLMMQTLRENITIVDPGKHMSLGVMRRSNERADVQGWLDRLDVRPANGEFTMSQLSGGNQQKVIVARELSRPLTCLMASQPTRGLDVGSIEYVHRQIVNERNQGMGVFIISSELDEVLALGDRIAVMYAGKINGIVGPSTSREDIGLMMAGSTVGEHV